MERTRPEQGREPISWQPRGLCPAPAPKLYKSGSGISGTAGAAGSARAQRAAATAGAQLSQTCAWGEALCCAEGAASEANATAKAFITTALCSRTAPDIPTSFFTSQSQVCHQEGHEVPAPGATRPVLCGERRRRQARPGRSGGESCAWDGREPSVSAPGKGSHPPREAGPSCSLHNSVSPVTRRDSRTETDGCASALPLSW